MSLKILTVDDSKAVRIIVKKSFTEFDVEIHEAANGVEGLALANKYNPDIILLDVTMPVMDGVEMLTKLKADPATKSIPVIMLTAEAGRDNVLKIAKIGIRDYIVKPFKDDVLIEKISRIIDLRPIDETKNTRKSLQDSCDIMLVEDKLPIVKQIKDGLEHTPWKIHGLSSPGEAIDFCQRQVPDLIVISLSLPDDAAFTLFRILRSNVKTKYVPIFGLAVKTATEQQKQAQLLGFTQNLTKPIDFEELEAKIARAINLDTSERYFRNEEDYLIISIPGRLNDYIINEIQSYLKEAIARAVDNGYYKVIVDASELTRINMAVIKLLMQIMQNCNELTVSYTLVGTNDLLQDCKGFEETQNWVFHQSIEEAKGHPLSV